MQESSSNICEPAGRGWGMWVRDDSHGTVILLHILNIFDGLPSYLRIFDCHDIAFDLKLGHGHSELYFVVH